LGIERRPTIEIRVVQYFASVSPTVEAFVDVEIDGWLRFNGLNLLREGTLRSAQLTPWRNGRRMFRDAVQVVDADLDKLLSADILAAIQAYAALLPGERRRRPPLTPDEIRALPQPPPPQRGTNPAARSTAPTPRRREPLPPPARLSIPTPHARGSDLPPKHRKEYR
jgi:hypothetical protein